MEAPSTKYLLAIIFVLAAFVVYLSIRMPPKTPGTLNTDGLKHRIDSLTDANTKLEQDALKQSVLIQENIKKTDSIEKQFTKQLLYIESIKGKYVKLIQAVSDGNAKQQVELLKKHLQ